MTDVSADSVYEFTFICMFFECTVNKDARQSMASDVSVCVDSVMDC